MYDRGVICMSETSHGGGDILMSYDNDRDIVCSLVTLVLEKFFYFSSFLLMKFCIDVM